MKLIVEADGGSRGNPGLAGSGTVVLSADKSTTLKEIAYVVGTQASNNVAEYRGLIEGLRASKELGASDVDVFMDSKLVVEQMSGRWKIKHPDMKVLALEARELASMIGSVTYTWIPREKNKRADALSNVAMDAAAAGKPVGPVDDGSPAKEDRVDLNCPATAPSSWNATTSDPTRLLLLRHGQTPMSAARQYSGISNPDLSDLGRAQAQAAATFLARRGGIDAIVCSPLNRTRQTAEAAAAQLGLDVEVMDGLIETDFGRWDGLTFAQAQESDPDLHSAWLSDPSVAPPDGETLQQAHRRVKKAREQIQAKYGASNVLVVSHVTPIKSILRQALEAGPSLFKKLHLDLASLSIAEFYADGPTCVRLVNDTSYLNA